MVAEQPIRTLRSADYRRMPWKNGGGETREIAVSPAHAALDVLDWRISLATVASDGPFSVFDGITRTLSVLQGNGITLRVGDAPPTTLLTSSAPFTFDGAAATSGSLVSGPITDLNVMSRRGRARHVVARLMVHRTSEWTTAGDTTVILCREGILNYSMDNSAGELNAQDCAIVYGKAQTVALVAAQPADVYLIEIYLESLTR